MRSTLHNFSLQQDEWYELEVDWQKGGDHTFTVRGGGNSATISCTDTHWASGGIGFIGFVDESIDVVQYDYVTKNQRRVSGLLVEDFEDGDLTEYTFDYGSSGASITDSYSYTEENALKLSDADVSMVDVDALPAPSRGDTFSSRIRIAANDPFALFNYGAQDVDNFYSVRLRSDTDKISILKQDSGGFSELAGNYVNFDIKQDVWYKVEVDWTPRNDHIVTVTGDGNSATVSCTDTTWSTGGIGFTHFVGSSGGTAYYDSVQIEPVLGNYEATTDGWTTSSNCTLTRVTGSQEPACVTNGDHALEVTVNSDSHPAIENQQRFSAANCSATAYLLADVLPAEVENSDSHVTFQFRYHHTDPGGVEESPEMTVEQRHGGVLAWDVSHLSAAKLDSPDRVEIAWYPTDHPPSSGFDYNGRVLVDNVRLSSNQNVLTDGAFFQKHRELELAHGLRTDQVIQSETDTTQDGVYKFNDGTEISYTMEKVDDGVVKETVDGDTFRWTGGSQ